MILLTVLCSVHVLDILFHSDRPTFGGGVLILCRADLNPVQVQVDFSVTGCDCLVIDLQGPVPCRIVCCYRPPSASAAAMGELCQQLAMACDGHEPIVVVGDFNLPYVNWVTYSAPRTLQYDAFLDFVNAASLSQLVLSSTRQENILDLVLTSDELFVSRVAVVDCFGTSDHSAVQFSLLGSNEVHYSTYSTTPLLFSVIFDIWIVLWLSLCFPV